MNNFIQTGALHGWQCPICGRVLAPFMTECPCKGQGPETWTSTSGTDTIDIGKKEVNLSNKPTAGSIYIHTDTYFDGEEDCL